MDCKPSREIQTWKMVTILGVIISILIVIGVAVANPLQTNKSEPTAKPEIIRFSITTIKKIPNLSWYCADKGHIFDLDDSIKVTVCKDQYVDIRVWEKGPTRIATRFNARQWREFLTIKDVIEQAIGIYRIDEKITLFMHHTPFITLSGMVNGVPTIKAITITQMQWLQLINMTKKINNALGMEPTNDTRQA